MADFNEVYCRWAEVKYGLKNVTSVDFEPRYLEGCPTCGGDTFIEVVIRFGKNKSLKTFEEYYGTELINSILTYVEGP